MTHIVIQKQKQYTESLLIFGCLDQSRYRLYQVAKYVNQAMSGFSCSSLHQLMSSSILNSLSGKTNLRAKKELCASVMYKIFKCF